MIIPWISNINKNATDQHVPEIELQIRVIKERSRYIWSNLPLNKIPVQILIDTILFVILWINDFPPVCWI